MTDTSILFSVLLDSAVLLGALMLLQELVRHAWYGTRAGIRYGGSRIGRWRERVTGLSPIVRFNERFPSLARFIAHRFDASRFSGLPLTLIGLALVYVVLMIGGIVEELFEGDELGALDEAIFGLIAPLRSESVLLIAGGVTRFADSTTIIAVALVMTAMLWAHGPQRFILPFWVSVLGAQATTTFGKYVLDRSRPDFTADVPGDPSFPSGHSTSAVSTYLLIAYILVRDMKSGRRQFLVVYWLCVLAGLIAFSRIVLGVHYASDVAAGVLVGGFWAAVAITLAELIKRTPLAEKTDEREQAEVENG